MNTIKITISNLIATANSSAQIVSDNTGYQVQFTFDSDWDNYPLKTAVFVWYQNCCPYCVNVPFSGNTVNVPRVPGINTLYVGVTAGDLITTTPAQIKCNWSILSSGGSAPEPPVENVYDRLMDLLNSATLTAGDSAYEIAVRYGYDGSEAQWLQSLHGSNGSDGHTPVKGVDYYTQAEKAEFEDLIMEEMTTRQQLSPEFANDISQCADTSKLYVLPDGFIYAYMQTFVAGSSNFYNPETALFNHRLNSSGEAVEKDGALALPMTDVVLTSPYIVNISGVTLLETYSMIFYVGYYDANKNFLGYTNASSTNYTFSDGVYSLDLYNTDYANAAYVRIWLGFGDDKVITPQDTANLYVEFASKSTGGSYEFCWNNTGHAFVPADYENQILAIADTAAAHAESIDILNQQVRSLADGSVPYAYPAVWDEAVEACITKIKAIQQGRNCVTFPFFSDNHQRLGYAGALIAKVMDECHMPYCFYGGDSISNGYIESEAAMIQQDRAFDQMMQAIPNGRLCRAVGNHDGYWAVSSSEKHTYPRPMVYDLFLREAGVLQNKQFGGDGTYYYVEDTASKVRFIVLNSNGGSIDGDQLTWLSETALQFTESGWAVVLFSHAPITNNFHASISNARAVQALLRNFINSGTADVVGWFAGHIHRDRIYQCDHTDNTDADDTTTVGLPFKTVTITSDANMSYDAKEDTRDMTGDTSHAIDFVTINKDARTVYMTRLGIGKDRSYRY